MSNRFVVTISDFPITGVSHPTAEEAGRKEGDGASHPFYSIAELVPVEEIEKLRASAAGEKVLEEAVGEMDRQANKDSDEIVALMARVGNLEAKRATHETDLPGDKMSKNRFAVVDKNSDGVCPRSFQTAAQAKEANPPYDHFAAELVPVKEIEELRRVLEEHKRQIEDYAVEQLRLADAKLARLAGVCDPAPDAEEESHTHSANVLTPEE